MDDNIDVLCINCENMISIDKISIHSSVCLTPTNFILKLNSANPLKVLNFRLDKLKCSIESIIHDQLKQLNTDEKMIFTYLSRYSTEILSIAESSKENAEICFKSSKEISDFPTDFVSPCVSLYLERVRAIISEKGEYLLQEAKIKESGMNLESILESRALQLEGLNKQIQVFKTAATKADMKSDLLDIQSIVDDSKSKTSLASSLSPKDAGNNIELDDLDNMLVAQKNELFQQSNEDLQKYFYSKCLVMKLRFSSRDPAQFIQIPDLYRKVREMKLPVDMWEEFIKQQFNNPEAWIKKK